MSQPRDNDERDRALWRRHAADSPADSPADAGGPTPDPNDLAAYLDGTAEPGLVERIEARLAADPDLLEEVLELRDLAGPQDRPVPAPVLRRAKALVPARRRGGVIAGPWRRLRWAAAAAAVVLACLAGYTSGRHTSRTRGRSAAAATVAGSLEGLIEDSALEIGEPNGGES